MSRTIGRLTLLLVLLLAAVIAVPLGTILPLLRDDWALDHVVVAVALDWRDFGAERARQQLQFELDRRDVGGQVTDEDCTLSVEPDDVRTVACRWEVTVDVPLVGRQLPMSFASVARIDRHGVLVR